VFLQTIILDKLSGMDMAGYLTEIFGLVETHISEMKKET
jgi:hypothetical protein